MTDTFGNPSGPTKDPICTAVIEEVANTVGTAPSELMPPLYEVIDPEALGNLFQQSAGGYDRSNGRITFTYADCRVVVDGSEEVTATPLEQISDPQPDDSSETHEL